MRKPHDFMAGGLLIALEGIDASGTTTQLERLAERLRTDGHAVHTTAEPSEGPVGRLIRTVLKGEEAMTEAALALLFAADRLDHLQRELEPAIGRGAIVLTDRYVLSSLAYQSIALPQTWVEALNERARPPDATFFLKVTPEEAAERRRSRGGTSERFDALGAQRQIAQRYEAVLADPWIGQLLIVDGMQGPEAVTRDLMSALAHLLAARGV